MKPTSSSKYSQVISLLNQGYSICQIESMTNLGRSTIGRIRKTVDADKENNQEGYPSKLSSCDKSLIIH